VSTVARPAPTADLYRIFAQEEARGRSPLYETFTSEIAGDDELLARLERLPAPKRQPNLFLAAVRFLFGTATDYPAFRTLALDHWDAVAATMLTHRTQTNEVGRCAALLPILAQLPQPLALLEVGTSAGLCLLLDKYRYDYGDRRLGSPDSPVTLTCRTTGAPLPHALPDVVWRAGLDLEPVDVTDTASVRWLEALVWPDEPHRQERLSQAIEIARSEPPTIVRGDLAHDLAAVARSAPEEATLVVFHTAVLTYVPVETRRAFPDQVAAVGGTWISNEALGVLPAVEETLRPDEAEDHRGGFLLGRDGQAVAWTDPHGNWLEWR
jgi:hypothetical protein